MLLCSGNTERDELVEVCLVKVEDNGSPGTGLRTPDPRHYITGQKDFQGNLTRCKIMHGGKGVYLPCRNVIHRPGGLNLRAVWFSGCRRFDTLK